MPVCAQWSLPWGLADGLPAAIQMIHQTWEQLGRTPELTMSGSPAVSGRKAKVLKEWVGTVYCTD